MKKKDLVAYIADKSGFTKKDSELMLDCIFDDIDLCTLWHDRDHCVSHSLEHIENPVTVLVVSACSPCDSHRHSEDLSESVPVLLDVFLWNGISSALEV